MFSFFKKKSPPPSPGEAPSVAPHPATPVAAPAATASHPAPDARLASPALTSAPERKSWIDKLKTGLRKTGTSIATVFTGTQIDDALYEDLESALLMADTGVKATQHLLDDL